MRENIRKAVEHRTLTLSVLAVAAVLAAGTISATTLLGSSDSGDLVAEYRFDTGAGNTAYDTEAENDGSISGANWVSGFEGKALSFDGADDYVGIASSKMPSGSEPFTISAWVRIPSDCSSTGGVFGYGNWGSSDQTNALRTTSSCSGLYHYFWSNDLGTGDIGINDNNWHHVAVSYDGGSSRKIFVDGAVEASDSPGSVNMQAENANLGVTNTNEYFRGDIDNLKIYSRNLNTSQIRSLYSRGSWRIGKSGENDDASKVLDISFQHQNSTRLLDTSGYENHGTPQNGASQESALNCKIGRCYSFDGNNDFVQLGDMHDPSYLTISAWVKPDATGGENEIVSKWGDLNQGDQYAMHLDSGVFYFRVNTGNGAKAVTADAESGKWQHLTGTYNGTHRAIYVNGQLKDIAAQNGTIISSGADLEIGSRKSGQKDFFDGNIDQVKIFNRSLSQEEIVEKTEVLESGAAVDYGFDRDAGDVAHDSSVNGNDARITSGSDPRPERVDGVDGNALKMNPDDTVDIPDSQSVQDALSGDEATIAFWVDLGEISQSYNNWFAWTASNDGGAQSARLEHIGAGHNLYVRWIVDPASAGFAGDGGVWARSLPDKTGERFLHVSTFENTSSGFRVRTFINDEMESESTSNDDAVLASASNIGSFSPSEAPSTIDNLQIYPYAVSKSRVKEMYQSGESGLGGSESSSTSLENSLVLEQSFDRIENCGQSDTVSCPSGMSGEVAVDESGNANHGDVVGSPTREGAKDCIRGNCLEFDGGQYIDTNTPGNFGKSPFSVSMWVYNDGSVSFSSLIDTTDGSGGWKVRWHDVDFSFIVNGTEFRSGNFDQDEWTHLVWMREADGTLTLYQDGRFAGSQGNPVTVANSTENIDLMSNPGGGTADGKLDEVKVYDRSLSESEIWNLYTNGRDHEEGMGAPAAHYPMQVESSPLRDVSGEGNHGDLNLLGESGTFNTSDGEWKTIRFERSYEDPVVVGTPNTHNGEAAIYFEVRNVRSGKAEMRLCESEGGNNDGCDTHGTERAGYIVVDAASTDDIPGIEAGKYENTNTNSASFSESFSNAPFVFAQPQTDRGQGEVVSWTTSRSISGFNVKTCDQNSNNGCSGPDEEIGWIAVEPGNEPFEQPGEANNLSSEVGNSDWASTTFSSSFTERPVGIFSVQNNDGGQDPKVDEIRNVGTSSMEMRFCELETGDNCDGHATMEYGYLAVSEGLLTYSNGNFPRYVDTDRGKALDLDGSDDQVTTNLSESLQEGSFSTSFWMKPDGTPSNGRRLLFKDNGGGGWAVSYGDPGSGRLRFYIRNLDTTSLDTGSVIEAGKWHHVTAVRDAENDDRHIYVDGELVASINSDTGTASSSNDQLVIGAQNDGTNSYDGKIDDVRVYPYALSQNQVDQVMNNGGVSVG